MNYIVKGMRELPGRKAVMLLSDGYNIVNPDQSVGVDKIRREMERVIDSAGRAGVVVYTVDARGLVADGQEPHNADFVSDKGVNDIQGVKRTNRERLLGPQDGLSFLAEQTGGFSVANTNDLVGGIRKALDDQKSYYLIGFQPDASAFDKARGRLNRLTVKVKGSGLNVRYRSGYMNVTDEEVKPIANTPERQIMRALTSPFASDDISLRLTPLFGNDAKGGSFVRSLVHIPVQGLTFTDRPDGAREAVINVVAYTFDEEGKVVNTVGETHTVTLADNLYKRALASGLVYSLNLPVKKAGAYQLRVAVRDDKSAKVGSASQFINIPDLNKDRLALSGIALSGYDRQQPNAAAAGGNGQPTVETVSNTMLTQAALRRFSAGQILQFTYAIYNARLDKSRRPRLLTQVKLYRDGKEIFAGKETPYVAQGQPDPERLLAEGSLQLGGLQEGEYVLQVVVTDSLAGEKRGVTTGWINFDVVR
jgi:hypothetical protein